jgi:predicted branched-subunit amino acid permease
MVSSKSSTGSAYRNGARAVAPLALAIGVLGVVFGYVARSAGLSATGAVVMSATTFAGSPQFAAVSILGAGGTMTAAVAAAAVLSLRFAAMSLVAAPTMGGSLLTRLLTAQLVVDETWAVAYVGEGLFSRERLIGAGLVLYLAHVGSTGVGALAGGLIRNPEAWGVDVMPAALFVLLIWPRLHGSGLVAAAIAALTTLALIPLVPFGVPILAAAVASLTLGLAVRSFQ